MRTIGDKILDMAMDENNTNTDTRKGIILLELNPNDYNNNAAGNLFLAALKIIRKQKKQLDGIKEIANVKQNY